jgi:Zn-dependent peptidase ImmA (M78 family)
MDTQMAHAPDQPQPAGFTPDEEAQASDFAAAILMPTDSFLAAVAELKANPFALAQRFQVPVAAVHRRAAMLHLDWNAHPNPGRYDA